jgi:voltage-gated potassium channel
MGFLAIAYVAVGFALDDAAYQSMAPALERVELGLTIVFVAEFASRFGASRNRRGYLRGHWIDLVALIPAGRALRILRTLRLLRLVRAFAGFYRALSHVSSLAEHRGLQMIVLSWLGVMVICTATVYVAEGDINPAIHTPFDALWWGVTTMTTVGYGDVVPMTAEGRIAASVLMLLGIALFSAVTAIITSFLLSTERATPRDPIADLERLEALRRRNMISGEEFAAKRSELLSRI